MKTKHVITILMVIISGWGIVSCDDDNERFFLYQIDEVVFPDQAISSTAINIVGGGSVGITGGKAPYTAEIEDEQMREVIYPLLPPAWHREIEYYTQNEFDSKIIDDGEINMVTSDLINEKYNEDKYNPIDGQIIRGCDHLSAYIEAYMSLSYGIKSEQMQSGYDHLKGKYKDKVIGGINFGELFSYFVL